MQKQFKAIYIHFLSIEYLCENFTSHFWKIFAKPHWEMNICNCQIFLSNSSHFSWFSANRFDFADFFDFPKMCFRNPFQPSPRFQRISPFSQARRNRLFAIYFAIHFCIYLFCIFSIWYPASQVWQYARKNSA